MGIRSALFVIVSICCSPALGQDFSVNGTGFFVSSNGHILTNYHVTSSCKRMQIETIDGSSMDAKILAIDQTNDLAQLSTSAKPAAFASFQERVQLGGIVHAYGFPLSGLLSSSGNFTSGMVTATAGIKDDSRMLQISAPVQPGNSGGPLISDVGAVVGVVTSKLNALEVVGITKDIPQNVNFAIKASAAVTFMQANDLSPTVTQSAGILAASKVADVAKTFTVKMLCAGTRDEAVAVQAQNEVAAAQTSGPTLWNHNGSIVQLESQGNQRRIYYENPRSEVMAVGVRKGTLLFEGTSTKGRYRGTAYYFHHACGPVAYSVEGSHYRRWSKSSPKWPSPTS